MQAPLKEIRNELKAMNAAELNEVCLRLARYKKENKELLNYLLFYPGKTEEYLISVKEQLQEEFRLISRHDYFAVKSLRKILRQLGKHARFTASKWAEADLLTWFCQGFLEYTNTSSSYKPLRTLFNRQMIRILKLSAELHDDLRHDLMIGINPLITRAEGSLKGFRRKDIGL